ncbi:hypothetical protein [Hyphomicrobium sulfonivorans]|uniref:hypothetical protein n=1 Tax=Hyphomicrobium sulfonivorans TaxID=121290 RepID=UPI00156F07DC|nr:hypothetical protein [Hyphomicrobium sulfonivorans]MBI1651174.1 hypothetical protein [Hyphomicrobium sulfonivorans]NSL72442.1 hypothetical protein [Hyphomicrobium sulfonivorans]
MSVCTVWVAYNTEDQCFASHESAQEAVEGLTDNFGCGEGVRVVELKLTLPTAKPLTVKAIIPSDDGPVSVTIE